MNCLPFHFYSISLLIFTTRLEVAFDVLLLNPLNTFGPVLRNYHSNNKLFLPPNSTLSSVCRLCVLRSLPNIPLSYISLLIICGDLFCTILLNLHLLILSKEYFLLSLLASCIPSPTVINSLLKFVLTSSTKSFLLLRSFYGYLDVQL